MSGGGRRRLGRSRLQRHLGDRGGRRGEYGCIDRFGREIGPRGAAQVEPGAGPVLAVKYPGISGIYRPNAQRQFEGRSGDETRGASSSQNRMLYGPKTGGAALELIAIKRRLLGQTQ